ncbi:DUF3037 domain-containing protein [Flammeovirga yaeyamensis]|uniref:DUF3037 domain-containing protein n=1 Tax=Flammeovirga yaeyamensis TaxID=367791 RepID=A0AAX1N816_9BACT|nr:DUF3037 domain-containing protein [Flammeovirga yaeyamensis]MBB3700618.1 hypothetical protein [Flammeovirga yaeyamensis]NMF37734.1 DUF3037 domain-containing protein [Flammeovirga yaeyamensis]QWG02043.1 DUF3037 domain-containing protein [Flammeovirga yaeyamensis]
MQEDKYVYEYAVIRFVPKVEREEFMNVGVILFCKNRKYIQMKYHIDETLFNAFSPEISIDEVYDYLKAWELVCEGKKGGVIGDQDIPSRFRWLTATRSTLLQCGKVHPGMCEHPENILEGLFEKYVGR